MVGQVDEVQRDRWVANEIDLGRARFIAQGTDANDVEQTLGRISRAEDWCREWSATGDMHQVLASEAEKSGRTISAGEAYIMAALAYHWGKMRWQLVLKDEAQYHQAHQKSIETFWKGLQYLDSTAERVEIPYEGITMPAHLRKPKGVSRAPVVLLLPGSDSVKEEFYLWADVFLKRGMATLAPDGPGQGETRNKMSVRHDYEGAGSAMIDFLEQRSDVDASAIGVTGVSMGGYYAPRVAAFEHRVKAAVSISGAFKTQMSADRVGEWIQFTHWAKTPEAAAQKANLRTMEGVIGNMRCPYLVVNGKLDAQTAYTNTEELAQEAKAAGVDVSYVLYEEGTHVCFNIPYKYRPLVGDWMAARLMGT